jgi:hypothetical protein
MREGAEAMKSIFQAGAIPEPFARVMSWCIEAATPCPTAPVRGIARCGAVSMARTRLNVTGMAKPATIGLSYGALRKECLDAVRQWPGCETIAGIQIVRHGAPGSFSVRVTLYGTADKKIANRAINCVQREKRRHFHLND